MCFLYELHEYIELLKSQYNFDDNVTDCIDDVENNIIDIYYNNKIFNLKEQINTILYDLIIEYKKTSNFNISDDKSEKIINEMKENIIDIYGINKKKKKEYYSYICDIKNIIIE